MASTHEQDKQGLTIAVLPFDSGSLEKASPRAIELARSFIQNWIAEEAVKHGTR